MNNIPAFKTIQTIFRTFFVNPLINLLIFFYVVTGNLGISIILVTLLIRAVVLPFAIPSMRQMKKQGELQPELQKIKSKYKNDKQKLAQAQMELFKQHGINPASGCLSQIPMFVVLVAMFSAIRLLSSAPTIEAINNVLYFNFLHLNQPIDTQFLFWNLTEPAPYKILPLLAGVLQFVNSKMMMGFNKAATSSAQKTPEKNDDIAYNVQRQSLYLMPVFTVIISLGLPSGVVLYIVTTTVFSIVQTYFLLGGKNMNDVLSLIGVDKKLKTNKIQAPKEEENQTNTKNKKVKNGSKKRKKQKNAK